MNKIIMQLIAWLLVAVSATSCMHENLPECPALKIEISVKDKNYSNVNKIPLATPVSEDLPFREYVSTICWQLVHIESGEVVAVHKECEVEGDDKILTLDFGNHLPFGDYELTVWGNLSTHNALADDHSNLTFHPANDCGDDAYMTRDLIHYDIDGKVERVELERTKGKLLVEKINVPEALTSSHKRITSLYGNVDKHFGYDGETYVEVFTQLPADRGRVLTESILSPSTKDNGSVVSVTFSDAARATADYPDPADVNVTMKRNELTVVRYVWDDASHSFKIYVLIDAGWEEQFKLEI